MKTLFITLLILLSTSVMGQNKDTKDDLYYSPQTKRQKEFSSDIQKIQYCLREYHNERQLGYMLGLTGAALSGAYFVAVNYNSTGGQKIFLIASFVADLTSIIVFYDAEKWLKRGSISISPTSLKLNF